MLTCAHIRAFLYKNIYTLTHFTKTQKKWRFGEGNRTLKNKKFVQDRGEYWLWNRGNVISDESDEVLIKIQEWKFGRNGIS